MYMSMCVKCVYTMIGAHECGVCECVHSITVFV